MEDKFIAYTNTACCQVTVVSGPWKRDGCKTLLVVLQPCGFMFGFPLHPPIPSRNSFFYTHPSRLSWFIDPGNVASSLRNSFAFSRSAFDEHELRRSSVRSHRIWPSASCVPWQVYMSRWHLDAFSFIGAHLGFQVDLMPPLCQSWAESQKNIAVSFNRPFVILIQKCNPCWQHFVAS